MEIATDRDFRLHKGSPFPTACAGSRAASCAHDALSEADDETLGTAVHETRKAFKRLRTSVRLTRDALGEETYAHERAVSLRRPGPRGRTRRAGAPGHA